MQGFRGVFGAPQPTDDMDFSEAEAGLGRCPVGIIDINLCEPKSSQTCSFQSGIITEWLFIDWFCWCAMRDSKGLGGVFHVEIISKRSPTIQSML